MLPGLAHFADGPHTVPTYVHALERDATAAQIGVSANALAALRDGDEVRVGAVVLRVIHTPGHSPGGMTLVARPCLHAASTSINPAGASRAK